LFAGPQKPSTLSKWAELGKPGSIGLVAPFSLTHRKPPVGQKLWPHDATTGDFRSSPLAAEAIGPLRESVVAMSAACVVFRSPETFSPSAANRDQLRTFFTELATEEAIGTKRVWVPGGLWEVRPAVKLAEELGVTCAIDPLVHEPGETEDPYVDLEASSLYVRIESTGRAGMIRNERLEDLAALVESYEHLPITVAFNSPERWQDARNFVKLLNG
jgi:uncharacterized protein YecE (DUF72 family)